MIRLKDIHKSYRSGGHPLPVLRGISAEMADGSFTAICGPSGCGKSTLLLIIGGLLRPDRGEVLVGDDNLFRMAPAARAQRRARMLGFVFQRFHLVPYLTVRENIVSAALALDRKPDGNRLDGLLNRFSIADRRNHLPGKLSVGERQRTALARALYNEPDVLLADEPTGNLDPDNADVVLKAFADFAASGGTVVMVTHAPSAAGTANQVLWLKEGCLCEDA